MRWLNGRMVTHSYVYVLIGDLVCFVVGEKQQALSMYFFSERTWSSCAAVLFKYFGVKVCVKNYHFIFGLWC